MHYPQRLVAIVSSLAVFVTLALFLISSWPFSSQASPAPAKEATFTAAKTNLWVELTDSEATQVYSFLYDEARNLNLTKDPRNGYDNYVMYTELLRPNKTDVLPYLSDEAAPPPRYARVALSQTVNGEAYIMYYAVGPLPISDKTTMQPLDYCYNAGRNWVKNPVPSFMEFQEWGLKLSANVSDITLQLLGAAANPADADDPEGLLVSTRPVWIEDGTIIHWMQLYRPGIKSNARSILPQGLYVKLNTSSTNSGEWKTLEWYYNGIFYETTDDLRAAIKQPDFELLPMNLDGPWTDMEDFEASPPGRELPPPVMVQPQGARYRLDKDARFVSWMGFEFYVSTSQSTGVSLFDIKFKGDSVIYELGMQEAMAHYAGDDPTQGGQEFLDTFFGMGKMMFELVPGYDCPAYADFLSMNYHETKSQTTPNSICIFEYTADHALQRHTSRLHLSISKSTNLIVRFVSTVGNYDYTIDYLFFLDGTIEVKVRASGFIFAAFYPPQGPKSEGRYGYRIHDAISSSMHDHVINFKADFDIAGVANDFQRLGIEPMTTSYSWDKPEVPQRNTMHLVEYPLEKESGIDWPKNSGQMYLIYHADKLNAWGERRGYRITPGTGMGSPPHLTILNSTTLGNAARWAEKDLWVLRRKDTEQKAADPLNFISPLDPIVDFAKMADRETLLTSEDKDYDGDLVVYFNLGAHHVAHTGDIPNTLMHTSASSVMFVPHNFNDRDPSRETVNGVRLNLDGKNGPGWIAPKSGETGDLRSRVVSEKEKRGDVGTSKTKIRYFGATYDEGVTLDKEALEPGLKGYDSRENRVSDLSWNAALFGPARD
ncbi:hypothetical protein M8818_004164 [Zalaria obscura]|uniref:Uncharacterized protein n=1 Tax=Zalaria obscura TaxID=2024903 RepID=A0ACC3SGV8_9PEZI